MKRAIVLILDGVGIGELPDADQYGDQGSNTLGNLAQSCGGLNLPFLEKLGLGNIADIAGVKRVDKPLACFGKMAERSPGKDSTSGHWELLGVVLKSPFPTYPEGFPDEIIKELESRFGHKILGNKPASGTEIIKQLGEEHIRTKSPIVYTSADSVLQIACHIDVFSLEELYKFCEIAREVMQGKHNVARVIARPFAGSAPNFYRTKDRRDFSLPPPEPTLLDLAQRKGYQVIVIGKVDDLFSHRGYDRSYHSVNDLECVDYVLKSMDEVEQGLIVANFVQFDMDWGHRNNIEGFKNGLIEIDGGLKEIIENRRSEDLIFITADHGNDPTTPSTDHSREYVPILAHSGKAPGVNLGIRRSFSDLAKTIARYLDIEGIHYGEDFLDSCLS
ncbi:phosphopentomutase [candidate division WOR-3 bacterium 4484_100]|uniref:Phosphopentomutase n=1 Tax=candidate division WOR-3 bacterium 4484_100 TaxID=1936077 RepID=A0A1V4QIJ6_UNCW3|nr:MAG: phosphopentomutase [candidate division WOR-3 bacterium 4484_100]